MKGPRLRYHHLGMPTSESRGNEYYLADFGVHVVGYENDPFRIEWMRFEEESPIPELVKTMPHLAFQVEDLEAAVEGHQILIPPNSPSKGVRVVFILHQGAPVELLEFEAGHPDRLPEESEEEAASHG
jgi:hypothetical protein